MSKKKDLVGRDAWNEAIRANEALICKAPDCQRNRVNLSPFCGSCRQHARRNGSPAQKGIRQEHYRKEREKVARLWANHRTEPAFVLARKMVETLFFEAEHKWTETFHGGRSFKYDVPGRRILISIIQAGGDEETFLVYLCGMYIYAAERNLFESPRSLPILLGLAGIHSAGVGAKDYLKGIALSQVVSPRLALGSWARDNLLRFFVAQHQAIKRYESVLERREEILASFSLNELSDVDVLSEVIRPIQSSNTDDSAEAVK